MNLIDLLILIFGRDVAGIILSYINSSTNGNKLPPSPRYAMEFSSSLNVLDYTELFYFKTPDGVFRLGSRIVYKAAYTYYIGSKQYTAKKRLLDQLKWTHTDKKH